MTNVPPRRPRDLTGWIVLMMLAILIVIACCLTLRGAEPAGIVPQSLSPRTLPPTSPSYSATAAAQPSASSKTKYLIQWYKINPDGTATPVPPPPTRFAETAPPLMPIPPDNPIDPDRPRRSSAPPAELDIVDHEREVYAPQQPRGPGELRLDVLLVCYTGAQPRDEEEEAILRAMQPHGIKRVLSYPSTYTPVLVPTTDVPKLKKLLGWEQFIRITPFE